MEKLANEVELILLRIRSGQSLASACANAKSLDGNLKDFKEWQERWTEIVVSVQRGHYSALESIQSFLHSLRFEMRAQKLKKKKALMPMIQAWSVVGTALLFFATIKIFFADVASLPFRMELLVVFLMLMGVLWIYYLLKKFESNFWVVDWLRQQSLIMGQIKWGRSMHQVLKDVDISKHKWPEPLKKWWQDSQSSCLGFVACTALTTGGAFELRYSEYWSLCLNQFIRNESFLPLIESHVEFESKSFEDYCETLAEWLSVKLMLPLFLCFCPAFLLLCLGPMVAKLSEF